MDVGRSSENKNVASIAVVLMRGVALTHVLRKR